jgi:hypothetical protein
MDEVLLPSPVLAKATLRGNEYAWPFGNVEEAILAARSAGLATLGGQVQFRLPDGTCELYWRSATAADRQPRESWPAYVHRSAAEVLASFREKILAVDYLAEARQWPFLHEKLEAGVNILDFLCFVLYFQAEKQAGPGAAADRPRE